MIQELKTCTRCGNTYHANPNYFREDPRRSDGLSSHCVICNESYSRIAARRRYAKTKGMTLEEYDVYSEEKQKEGKVQKEARCIALNERRIKRKKEKEEREEARCIVLNERRIKRKKEKEEREEARCIAFNERRIKMKKEKEEQKEARCYAFNVRKTTPTGNYIVNGQVL